MDLQGRMDAIHKINYLTSEMDALYHQVSLKQGISDSVSMVLYTIYEKGGACLLSEIYKDTGVSKQTVNSAIRKLEAEGALYLQSHTGRLKQVFLTEQGKALASSTVGQLMEAEVMAFADWTDQDISRHVQLMERYLEDFRKIIDAL